MSKIIIAINTGNDVFLNLVAELSSVIDQIDRHIQKYGADDDFKIYNSNGNPVGHLRVDPNEEISANIVISIDTDNDDFNNLEAEMSNILAQLDSKFQRDGADSDFKIYDSSGNPVGMCKINISDAPRP